MNHWLQKQIDNDFSDFKGLNVTATIPLRDTLLNELIADMLRRSPAESRLPAGSQTPPGVDVRPYLRFVKKAEVHASEGIVELDVVIRID
jgi:hypothetical protein